MNIDYDKISGELKIRREVLERLILSFATSLPDKLAKIEEAMSANDTDKMRAILHEIKGTASNLRLETIMSVQAPLHEAVKAGETPEKLKPMFDELKEKSSELQKYLGS